MGRADELLQALRDDTPDKRVTRWIDCIQREAEQIKRDAIVRGDVILLREDLPK